MEKVTAFAPGNISCVFKIIPHEDPTKMHSLGMGFTIREGVTVTVTEADARAIRFNGAEIDFPTVVSVVKKLTDIPVKIEINSPLPLSSGFGLSGASALATAYAVNVLLGPAKSEEELAMAAHVAEVENLTGLGDVSAQYHGGCLVKLKEGYPLAADRLPVEERPIFYRYFGPIHTRSILADAVQSARINRTADETLVDLAVLTKLNSVDFNACIQLSKRFAVDSGLLSDPRVRQVIEDVEMAEGAASMIMLGHAVFSTQAFEGSTKTRLSMQNARVL